MTRFDLADLRLFLAILEAGTITRGSSVAHLSLAAASERLREMEASSGVALFVRDRRGVRPTRAGEALAHHARLVLRQVDAMQVELSEHASGIRGSVRVLANSVAIAEFIPDRMGDFLREHPHIDVDLGERSSVDIVKAVVGGLAEIGIVSDAVATGALQTRPFAEDQLVAVVAPTHPLAGRKRIAFSELAGDDFIAFDGALQRHIDEQAQREGVRLRHRIHLPTFEAICRMVSTGAGVGAVPNSAALRAVQVSPIRIVRLSDAWASRRLLLCCRNEADLDPVGRELLAQLADRDGHAG